MVFWKKKDKKDDLAGLAIMTSGIYYLELSRDGSGLSIKKYQFVSYPRVAVRQDSLVDHKAVIEAIGDLSSKIGDFPCPISLGFPSREVMIKNVDLPAMDLAIAKEAIQWEFDKYFPYPVAEAFYDVSAVDVPFSDSEDTTHLIVAAVRKKKVEGLLAGIRDLGISVKSLEPNNVATFRAMVKGSRESEDGYMVLVVSSESIQLVIGFHDSSLFYRSVPFPSESVMGVEELLNRVVSEAKATINYVKTIFREIKVTSIILGGDPSVGDQLKERLGAEMAIPVEIADPWRIWNISGAPSEPGESEVAVGLAVRDLS